MLHTHKQRVLQFQEINKSHMEYASPWQSSRLLESNFRFRTELHIILSYCYRSYIHCNTFIKWFKRNSDQTSFAKADTAFSTTAHCTLLHPNSYFVTWKHTRSVVCWHHLPQYRIHLKGDSLESVMYKSYPNIGLSTRILWSLPYHLATVKSQSRNCQWIFAH